MFLVSLLACKPPIAAGPVDLSTLEAGQQVEGFVVDAVYVDGQDQVVGTRLRHAHTGLQLRLLTRDTVPQAYLWVNTVPDSDRGEPHTQEHLLLGKGNRGRAVATREEMAMVSSSAFTAQHETVYHFRTTAGPDVFFDIFDARLDALLHPDYLDEEIRREVHHWGVSEGPDGLVLEEKGTVYNEMDSSFQQPGWVLWSTMPKDLYGVGHPQAFQSGGHPDALRTLTPDHIRSFHAATHHLANMGGIVFVPDEVPLVVTLQRLDATLVRLQPEATPADRTFPTADDLPPPAPVADRSVRELRYPHRDASGDATVTLAFPPIRDLSATDEMLLTLLLSAIAGEEHTNLYKAVVDSQTRERDLGASSVWAWLSDDLGRPVYMGVGGLSGTGLSDDDITWLAERLRRELADIAALPAGDERLVDLHRRIDAELIAWRRGVLESMTGPPGFGTRGTGTQWHDYLKMLDREGGFRRPLLLGPQMAAVEAALAGSDNLWTEALARWGLLDETPFVYVNRPSPDALAALSEAKDARVAVKLAALKAEAGTDDDQEALRALADAYDAATVDLEAAITAPPTPFLESPPLVLDARLDATARDIDGVPVVVGRFDAMSGAKLGLALDLTGSAPEHGMWMSNLSALMTQVGVVIDGTPMPHEAVLEQLQREVLTASAGQSTNPRTGRAELVLYASGTDPDETRAAMTWTRRFATSPDWRPENLPRLRDLVDQGLDGVRRRMLGPEERWAAIPPRAWQYQDAPLQLHLWSFLTVEHDLLRQKYRLMAPDADAVAALEALAAADLDRDALGSVLTALQGHEADVPRGARSLVPDAVPAALAAAAEDLEKMSAALPDASLADDITYLSRRLAADLSEAPEDALAELDALRRGRLERGGARVYVAGGALLDTLDPDLTTWLSALVASDGEDAPLVPAAPVGVLRSRITDRGGDGAATHVGLLEPNRRSGVLFLSAPLTAVDQLDEDSLLDYLAIRTLGGGGAHSLFIQTWGAGLAYSNGSSASETSGRMRWRAERCPKIPQTVDFVLDRIAETPIDANIAEYAIASAFSTREAAGYASRTSSYATDLVDGKRATDLQAFREAILALRSDPDLVAQLAARVPEVYGRLFPGTGAPTTNVDGAVSFAIGDADQLDAWEAWLGESGEGSLAVVHPRDFWIVAPVDP